MNSTQSIALYLPQFHRLPENDLWWGKGFTEWTAARSAKPLFSGHRQPREPLADNYYDLLDKRTMQWQADLAKKYKIDGFCFYHYWFKDGRRILEKPAENLLGWTDLNMPFCFCWANETWARSWDAVANKNAWADKFEPQWNDDGKGILLEQKYGEEKDWEEHFQYLRPFFRDERYIHVEKKPVFVIYRPELIPCLERMIAYWQRLAVSAGLSGLYMIGTNVARAKETFDAVIMNMSKNLTVYSERIDSTTIMGMDYSRSWEDYLAVPPVSGAKTLWCGIVDYDDTPRRGEKGSVYLGANPQRFGEYYTHLLQKSIQMDNPLVFINAWNEWGEGMYLEPDKVHGYAYLEAVKKAVEVCEKIPLGEAGGKTENVCDISSDERKDAMIERLESRVEKFRQYYELMHYWLLGKEQGRSLVDYFLLHGYRRVAIYGYGNNGKHLVEELRNSEVRIIYAIDQKADLIQSELPVHAPNAALPDCDVVVVTVIHEYGKILADLEPKIHCPIISLSEIILDS